MIDDELNELAAIKSNLRDSIYNKGVSISESAPFINYSEGIEAIQGSIDVDNEFDENSENPVQNKVIKQAFDNLSNVARTGSYNDLVDKPTIPSATIIDSSLSDNSTNPVQNKIIKQALDSKLGLDTTTTEVYCVIETYSSGPSWYRVWSDGWCEQGGIINSNQSTVSLLKPYINTNYSILMVGANYSNDDQLLGSSSRTVNDFTVSESTYLRFWQTCGYIS